VSLLCFDWLISLTREPIIKGGGGMAGPALHSRAQNLWRAWSLGISEHPLHKDFVVCTSPAQMGVMGEGGPPCHGGNILDTSSPHQTQEA
jgi:hypothetical protein